MLFFHAFRKTNIPSKAFFLYTLLTPTSPIFPTKLPFKKVVVGVSRVYRDSYLVLSMF